MRGFTDDEFEEWHKIILHQRDEYRRLLKNICCGVPVVGGMASPYRQLTLKEIKEAARKLLNACP